MQNVITFNIHNSLSLSLYKSHCEMAIDLIYGFSIRVKHLCIRLAYCHFKLTTTFFVICILLHKSKKQKNWIQSHNTELSHVPKQFIQIDSSHDPKASKVHRNCNFALHQLRNWKTLKLIIYIAYDIVASKHYALSPL